jgi:hypothetical protein
MATKEEAAVKPVVGTVLRHPNSGDVALCVSQYGKTYWRIYASDDRTWIETGIVGWDVLFDPQATEGSVDD